MELCGTVVGFSIRLAHDAPFQRCRSSHVRRSFPATPAGPELKQLGRGDGVVTCSRKSWVARGETDNELSSWRRSKISGGQFGTVELEFLQRELWAGKKLQRGERFVANSVKDEEAEVNSAAASSEGVQQLGVETGGGGGGVSFLTFLCPLLKLIGILVPALSYVSLERYCRYRALQAALQSGGDPAAPRNSFLESATSGIASLARLPWGSQVDAGIAAERNKSGQPAQLFQLYEFEACPFCRRVREALTELDLSAEVYPCPKGSRRHREFVLKNGGKEQFPYFHDPNTGVSLYESSEIVNYLFKEYGGGIKPTTGLLESTLVTGWVPTIIRAGRGMMLYPKAASDPPPKKLELFSYENNQFARLVRETLCELELPYILRNAGKGSSSRDSLLKLAGSTQVPYLVDPNTGKSMAESLNIVSYLFETYGASA